MIQQEYISFLKTDSRPKQSGLCLFSQLCSVYINPGCFCVNMLKYQRSRVPPKCQMTSNNWMFVSLLTAYQCFKSKGIFTFLWKLASTQADVIPHNSFLEMCRIACHCNYQKSFWCSVLCFSWCQSQYLMFDLYLEKQKK